MKCNAWLIAAVVLFLPPAYSAENGYTLGATELRDKPFLDATAVGTLAEKTRVEIVTRQGAWMQVRTRNNQLGWVRMLSVRLGSPGQKPQGGGNLLSAIAIASRPRPTTTATVTTGVRGFSEEDLAKAAPNATELARMKGYAATVTDAKQLAAQGNLEPRQIAYFDADGKPLKDKK